MPFCPCCFRVDLLRLPDLWGFCVGCRNLGGHHFGCLRGTADAAALRMPSPGTRASVRGERPLPRDPAGRRLAEAAVGPGDDAGHGARAPRARRVVVAASSDLLHALKHAGIPRPGPMRPAQPFAIAVSEPMVPLPRVIALTTSILGRAYTSRLCAVSFEPGHPGCLNRNHHGRRLRRRRVLDRHYGPRQARIPGARHLRTTS